MVEKIVDLIQSGPKTEWQVLGVDPAPSKNSTVCYLGKKGPVFESLKANELLRLLKGIIKQDNILITWDAPLTGPPRILHPTDEPYDDSYFYTRQIEKYFNNKDGCKTPDGINTRGYGGCPHWTITKAFTGLPLLGPYCKKGEDLPFQHIESTKEKLREDKPNIIEVHPALAMYLWLRSDKGIKSWRYKGTRENAENKRENCKLFYDKLKDKLHTELEGIQLPALVKDADELDAFVAWLLGYLYVFKEAENREKQVEVMGDQIKGSMLLPWDEKVFDGFSAFCL